MNAIFACKIIQGFLCMDYMCRGNKVKLNMRETSINSYSNECLMIQVHVVALYNQAKTFKFVDRSKMTSRIFWPISIPSIPFVTPCHRMSN